MAEAVFLSTRVVVMSPRPGRILGDVSVPFPYPRHPELRYTEEFAKVAGEVSDLLRDVPRRPATGDGGRRAARTIRLARTQAFWDSLTGEEGEFARQADYGRAMWSAEPNWGDWSIPESELRLLPDVTGMDTVELGCGTAYFSGWLARAGARPVGVDASERQLALARACRTSTGWTSRSCTPTPSTCPTRTAASTSPCPSTARAAGATRTGGCPRRPGCCARAAGSCSSWSARS